MDLLQSFGIEGKLLVWQIINFGLLFVVLWYVLYKPLRKIMSERERKVKDSLSAAADLEKRSRSLEHEFNEKLSEQRKEMQDMYNKTLAEQDNIRKEIKSRAAAEAQSIIDEARKSVQEQQKQILSSVEGEIKSLAVSLAAKIVDKELDVEAEKKFLDEALRSLKEQKQSV